MSGTPPFCTLGNNYYYDNFSTAYTLYEDTPGTTSTFNVPGWNAQFAGTYNIGNESIKIPLTINANLEHTITFTLGYTANRTAAIYLGMSDVFGYLNNLSILIQAYETGNMYIQIRKKNASDLIINLTGMNSWPYIFQVNFGSTLTVKINGSTVGSASNSSGAGSPIGYYYINMRRQIEPVLYTGYMRIYDLYIEGPDMPTACQGEIPTFHKEINSSTAKISHSRILREDRNATQALRFHNQMKETT